MVLEGILEYINQASNQLLIVTFIILILTFFLLIYSIFQLGVARMTVQQSLMPIMGLRVLPYERGAPPIITKIATKPRPMPFGLLQYSLIVFVRHGIALNIEGVIRKNREFFKPIKHVSAIPPLMEEIGLVVENFDISNYLWDLQENETLNFTLDIIYYSITDDMYEVNHDIHVNGKGKIIRQEYIFNERPWDPKIKKFRNWIKRKLAFFY